MALNLNDVIRQPGMVENLARELGGALEQTTGLDVTTTIDRERGQDVIGVKYEVRLDLRKTLTVDLDAIAVKHAGDPAAFIAEWIEHHLKPFGEQMRRAANAAGGAWLEQVNRAS